MQTKNINLTAKMDTEQSFLLHKYYKMKHSRWDKWCSSQAMMEDINTQYKEDNVNKKAGPQNGERRGQVSSLRMKR